MRQLKVLVQEERKSNYVFFFIFQKKHKIRCFLQQTHKWCTFITPYIAKGLTLLYHNSLVNILSMEDRK
jgi:hypothetical protein